MDKKPFRKSLFEGKSVYNKLWWKVFIPVIVTILGGTTVFYITQKNEQKTNSLVSNIPINISIENSTNPNLIVEYTLPIYKGANLFIANIGHGVLIVSDLTLEWDYSPCEYEYTLHGASLTDYKY
jgi:hypothetical protein